ASHHKDRHEIFLESEFLTRLPSIQTHQLGPDWSACNFCVGFWKKRRALLKAEHDRADYSRCQTVGFSRHGVRLVNKGGNAAHPPGQYRRCRSERSEEHTSELQSRSDLVCRLLLEKKNTIAIDVNRA